MEIASLLRAAEQDLSAEFAQIEERTQYHVGRVLASFRRHRVSDYHLQGSSGYGYGDSGRQVIESIYADIFGTESALVRGHFASGTHALTCALFGILRPGDELLIATGCPYDTLHGVIGWREQGRGSSLAAFGISTRVVERSEDGEMDLGAVLGSISPRTRVVYVQRSRGYSWQSAVSVEEIGALRQAMMERGFSVPLIVDNCYGEFVENREPGHVSADLTVGSLIKNPGGGLALSGGYIAGKSELVDLAAQRLYAPGIGGDIGATTVFNRTILQGLFLAPTVVESSLKAALLLARACELLGIEVSPGSVNRRTDIIQAVRLGRRDLLISFCQEIQRHSPIDSHVVPEPGALPGYESEVIMAAGTFIQGASSELSADAPLREPYVVYVQGGLSYAHARIAIAAALSCIRPGLSRQ